MWEESMTALLVMGHIVLQEVHEHSVIASQWAGFTNLQTSH